MSQAAQLEQIEEQCLTVGQIADLWAVSDNTVINLFRDEPGVLKLSRPSTLRNKRKHVTLRVPVSVLRRVRERISS